MGDIITRGELFDAKLTNEIFSKVAGHSTIARLCGQSPIPFNGIKEFTFTMDKDVDVVAENGAKGKGGATLAPVTIVPIKVEYGARVSDEFMYASEEEALDILSAWADGFAKKLAVGLDKMAFHGVNPRTGSASAIIGTNSFDTNEDVTSIGFDATDVEATLEDAVEACGDYDITGYAFSKSFSKALAGVKENGVSVYPEFKFGGNPGNFGGSACDVNATVSNGGGDMAIVGDFANAFKWGLAKQIPLEVIQYGNPDNDAELGDLKGHNQVYLRSEAYIGWGILAPEAFCVILTDEESE